MLKSNETAYGMALKKAELAAQWVAARAQFGSASKEGLDCDTRIRSLLVRPGYYEHFKSFKGDRKFYRVYRVLAHVNIQTGAHAYQVEYASLYGKQKNRRGLRELLGPDGFLTPIDRREYKGPRFVYRGIKRPKSA
jgi:hypothetical protein